MRRARNMATLLVLGSLGLMATSCSLPAEGAVGLTSPRGDVIVATLAMCPEETIEHVSVTIQDAASVEPPSVWELDAHGAGSTVVRLGGSLLDGPRSCRSRRFHPDAPSSFVS